MTPYFTQLLVFACVYALVAASVSITMGSAGLFNAYRAGNVMLVNGEPHYALHVATGERVEVCP